MNSPVFGTKERIVKNDDDNKPHPYEPIYKRALMKKEIRWKLNRFYTGIERNISRLMYHLEKWITRNTKPRQKLCIGVAVAYLSYVVVRLFI